MSRRGLKYRLMHELSYSLSYLYRYIFTKLSSLARLIFPPTDDTQLTFLCDDNRVIEPEWYCPIIPMVLVNGCEGIGTGYSTFVPNFDVREIVANLKRLMNSMEPVEMVSACPAVCKVCGECGEGMLHYLNIS